MEGGTGRPELSWPWLIGLSQSCRNWDVLDWQSFHVSQWPENQSMGHRTSGSFLVFLPLLADTVCLDVSLPFVSIPEDPLHDAEDKRSRAGMNFSTAGAEARGCSGHWTAQAFVTLLRKNKCTAMSSRESSK